MAEFRSAFVLLLFSCLAPVGGAAAQTSETVSVALSDYAFTPSALNLKAGVSYHLHLTNGGGKDHDFSAPQFFAAAQVAPEDQAKISKGAIAVGSGQAVDVTVTPGSAGTYALTCTHFMHSSMGMHGTITVQ